MAAERDKETDREGRDDDDEEADLEIYHAAGQGLDLV